MMDRWERWCEKGGGAGGERVEGPLNDENTLK